MSDSALSVEWPTRPDEDGCYEVVVPQQAIFMLTRASGDRVVNADGSDGQTVRHEDVEWFLDFSVMVDGELHSRRFVTQERLDDEAAKAWAVKVGEEYRAEIGSLS